MCSPSGRRWPVAEALQLEMGYSLAEFRRTLEGGFSAPQSGFVVTRCGTGRWHLTIADHPLTVEISATPAPPRRLGAMTLPVLEVSLLFTSGDKAGRQRFFDRFWRHFHKGGG